MFEVLPDLGKVPKKHTVTFGWEFTQFYNIPDVDFIVKVYDSEKNHYFSCIYFVGKYEDGYALFAKTYWGDIFREYFFIRKVNEKCYYEFKTDLEKQWKKYRGETHEFYSNISEIQPNN